MFYIVNGIVHFGHVCLLYPENLIPQPPKQLLTTGLQLIFKFVEIKLTPKGIPAFIFSKPKSLLICSKKPKESSKVCITI